MAETESKYADSLISQDVIDRLLKEAEDIGPDDLAQESPRPANGDAVATEDVIDQDDIDKLLESVPEPEEEEPELISQDDIDALLEGSVKKEKETPEEEFDEDLTDLDLVTPEDIEKLLSSETGQDVDQVPVSDDGFDQISQDDIDALLEGSELNGGDDTPAVEDDGDSLISQDDIDALLSGALNADISQDTSQDASQDAEPAQEIEASAPDDQAGDDSLISQDDIDRLLADSGETESVDDEADSNMISQEDIDNLIKGHVEEEEESEGETLITQEDIDRLLKTPEPAGDDDDIKPSESEEEVEQLVSQDDIDKLLNADFDDIDTDLGGTIYKDTSDQVILEKSIDSIDEPAAKKKPRKKLNKIVAGCVAAVLVLAVAGVSWIMFSSPSEDIEGNLAISEVAPEEEPEVEEPDVPEPPPPAVKELVVVTMEDFVVPAPVSIKGSAYISVNMTIEIVDVSSNPIKDYEPFFRNIIYEVLNKALVLQSESKIVEADLKRMIKEALNDALSEGYIAKIDFSEFKLG